MRKLSPVLVQTVALAVALLAATTAQAHTTEGDAIFGTQITLPGHINEVAVDEVRRLVYAANFSAGRVEVVSMDTQQRVDSFPTSPQPNANTGIAVSIDRQWLVATSIPVTPGDSTVTVVNLNDTSVRKDYPIAQQPLGVAFQWNNKAIIITETDLQEFDPVDGSLRLLYEFGTGVGPVELPVEPPTLPREILLANITSSADGRWIFGVSETVPGAGGFVFSYEVPQPTGGLQFRLTTSVLMVNTPVFNQVSGSPNGSHFMAGQLLFTNDLQIIADSPESDGTGEEFIGGTGYNPSSGDLYASFGAFSDIFTDADAGHPRRGILQRLDTDNLFVSSRIRLTERIAGRIQPSSDGTYAYAVSESGLLYLALSDLAGLPQLEVKFEDRSMFFEFDFCTQKPITKTLRIETPVGGQSAAFSLSADIVPGSGRPAVLFEPSAGVTPAEIQLTVDPGALGLVQGTRTIEINIDTNAVNIVQAPLVIATVRDVDQVGDLLPVPGHLTQVLGDPTRDRFYVLDDLNFKVLVFDSNTMTQIAEFRTGNSPAWMTLTLDSQHLIVANSRGEHVSVFELHNLKSEGLAYMPWRQLGGRARYPYSVATDAERTMIATHATPEGAPFGTDERRSTLHWLSLPEQTISTPESLGIYFNAFNRFAGEQISMAPTVDGDYVVIAGNTGGEGSTYLYESLSGRLIITRGGPLGGLDPIMGAVGAGADFYMAGKYLLNESLVPLGLFDDDAVNHESSGFTLALDGSAIRSIRPTNAVDTGTVQRIDPTDPTRVFAVTRTVSPPTAPSPRQFFSSTLSTLRDGRIISASSAGVVVMPAAFDSGLGNIRIEAITNGADFSPDIAPGSLISIFGNRFATQAQSANTSPLPTKLNGACVSANGSLLPLLYVGPNQINAQMLYGIGGTTSVQVHSADGIGDIFVKEVQAHAPAIFSVNGPNNTRFAAIFREDNTLATLSNPIRTNEHFVIYMTGLGEVNPSVVAGNPAPADILSETTVTPSVTIGGVPADVTYSGLTPGFSGLYQINARTAGSTPEGVELPMVIEIGGGTTTVNVRIIED